MLAVRTALSKCFSAFFPAENAFLMDKFNSYKDILLRKSVEYGNNLKNTHYYKI